MSGEMRRRSVRYYVDFSPNPGQYMGPGVEGAAWAPIPWWPTGFCRLLGCCVEKEYTDCW